MKKYISFLLVSFILLSNTFIYASSPYDYIENHISFLKDSSIENDIQSFSSTPVPAVVGTFTLGSFAQAFFTLTLGGGIVTDLNNKMQSDGGTNPTFEETAELMLSGNTGINYAIKGASAYISALSSVTDVNSLKDLSGMTSYQANAFKKEYENFMLCIASGVPYTPRWDTMKDVKNAICQSLGLSDVKYQYIIGASSDAPPVPAGWQNYLNLGTYHALLSRVDTQGRMSHLFFVTDSPQLSLYGNSLTINAIHFSWTGSSWYRYYLGGWELINGSLSTETYYLQSTNISELEGMLATFPNYGGVSSKEEVQEKAPAVLFPGVNSGYLYNNWDKLTGNFDDAMNTVLGGIVSGDIVNTGDVVDTGAFDTFPDVEVPDATLDGVIGGLGAINQTLTDGVTIDLENTLEVSKSETLDFSPLLALGENITNKFPFSLPWDLMGILGLFDAPPKAPNFEVDFKNQTISVLDLSQFESVVKIFRFFVLVYFISGLAKITGTLTKH